MPIYDYECDVCNHRFEEIQHFNDKPIEVCPKCRGKTRRVIHSSPIVFKGNGFYVTDSRSSSSTKE